MSNRIPPSLKWLIDKRARLDGEIVALEKSIRQFEQLSGKFRKLEQLIKRVEVLISELEESRVNLAAIDRALGLHDIQVEIENIAPIRSGKRKYLELPHGGIGKMLLTRLKQLKGKATLTDDLAAYIADFAHDLGLETYDKARIRQIVRYRLKGLATAGVIQRGPSRKLGTRFFTTWRLPG